MYSLTLSKPCSPAISSKDARSSAVSLTFVIAFLGLFAFGRGHVVKLTKDKDGIPSRKALTKHTRFLTVGRGPLPSRQA